jgi:energy-coupling factor transporter ATP-binding protein EcfA2
VSGGNSGGGNDSRNGSATAATDGNTGLSGVAAVGSNDRGTFGGGGDNSTPVDSGASSGSTPPGIHLTAEGLSHRWPGASHNSFGPLDFEVPAGGTCLLLGPNGSGKTSLLLRLAGLTRGSGRLFFDGVEYTPQTLKRLQPAIGFLWANPDDGLLLPVVWEDVALGPCNDGLPLEEAKAVALHWLKALGLEALRERPVRSLSLGQRQRVALAGILARTPRLLLLDEPLSHMDAEARQGVLEVLKVCKATCVVATHEPEYWREHGEAGVLRLFSL